MKKIYYVYILGKFCNTCYIKLAKNQFEAGNFFKNLGFSIVSIVEA